MSYPALAAIRSGLPVGLDTDNPIPPSLAVTVDPLRLSSPAVLVFSGKLGRCHAKLLVDSGASYNFVAQEFVNKNHLTTMEIAGPTIQVADGTLYGCNHQVETTVRIGHYLSKMQAYVLPLKGTYDVILGTPWLAAANPSIDWQQRTMTVLSDGQPLVLKPTEPPALPETPVLSTLQVYHEMRRGAKVFLAIVRQVEETPDELPTPPETSGQPELESRSSQTPLPDSIQTRIREHVERLKREYADVMPDELPNELPPPRTVDHKIELEPGAKPPNQKYYRLSYKEQEECKRQIEEGLAKGFIRPSTSPWGSPVLFVPKKNGTMRMCIDYRALNSLTVKNRTALPRIDDLMDQLRGARWYTSLDLRQGYHQIRMAEESIPITAFKTKWGLFEYTVLPFGLTNAPATFQTLMNDLFRSYLDQWLVVFLDDLLIYDKDLETHATHVGIVLEILRKNKLYVNGGKCDWFQPEITFLGHRVGSEGVSMEDGKVKDILDWPAPRNVADVRSFLGLAGYYRHFIQRYSHTALPLTNLLKDKIPFRWGEDEAAAFETLKEKVTSAPVLAFPDPDKPFIVTTDASGGAIGAVLSQDQGKGPQPIAFFSRKLKQSEGNYATHDKEMLALIEALKHWRHFLQSGLRHQAYTDHQALKYFATQPNLNNRQTRWMGILQEYNISIDYLPGKTNLVADALSRRPDLLAAITTVHTLGDFLGELKASYGQDEESASILTGISSGSMPEYSLQDSLIIRQTGNGKQLYIPPSAAELRKRLLAEHHDTVLAGHMGMDKTLACLARNYYWPGMKQEVQAYIRTCPCCQVNKGRNRKPGGLLQPLPVPEKRWECVTMDFITNLPKTTAGYDAILTCVDKLTKMVHLAPTRTTATALETAEIYFNTVTRLHGLQSSIISDRDPKFTSKFWEALMDLWETKLGRSTAFHPQTDGQTERTHRTLEEILRAYVSDRHDDWDKRMAAAEFAINNAPSASSGESPFFLNYGFHPLTPATVGLQRLNQASNQAAADFLQRLHVDLQSAKTLLEQARERQARYANTKREDVNFSVGDKVLLSTANLRLKTDGPASKFNPKWCGPFKIQERIGPVAYRLELPSTMRVHPVFHVSLLKPYLAAEGGDRQPFSRPPPIRDDDVFMAERLLDRREVKQGRKTTVEYLVQWQGYPLYEATWEPTKNLLGTELQLQRQALDAFRQRKGKSQTSGTSPSDKSHTSGTSRTAAEQTAGTTSVPRRSTRLRNKQR